MMWKKGLTAVLLAMTLCLAALGTAFAEETRFADGTIINSVPVGGMTIEEAKNQIESQYQGSYSLKIRDKDKKEYVIHDSEINFSLKVTDEIATILQCGGDAENLGGPGGNEYKVAMVSSYDDTLLREVLANLPFVAGAKPTSDARLSDYKEGEPYTIIPEVQGTEIDMKKFVPVVKAALDEQRTILRLEDTDSYKSIKVRSTDPELVQKLEMMNQFGQMEITYTFGDQSYTLTGEAIAPMILGATETGDVIVNEQHAAAAIGVIANIYDTYGRPHAFHTTAGNDITITRGAYGWRMNQAEETAALIAMIKTGKTQTREPAYLNRGASRGDNDYGNTYVEVDLANQHLYLYENGVCVVETPIVTGSVAAGNATPTGIYSVYSKERNRVLRGPKRADGTYSYESPVSYWMPFNGGVGLHDANWRGSFGGTIYLRSGSHGCVNMPPRITPDVWEHVYVGIPVICHNNE